MDATLVSLFLLIITSTTTTVGVAATTTHEIIWEKAFNRAAWESNHKCFMGDELLFSYNPEQNNVMSVSHADFKSCDPSSPYSTFRTGNTQVTIDRKDFYFISGVQENCRAGLKLHVQLSPVLDPSHGDPSVNVPRHSEGEFSVTTCTLFYSFLCTSLILYVLGLI